MVPLFFMVLNHAFVEFQCDQRIQRLLLAADLEHVMLREIKFQVIRRRLVVEHVALLRVGFGNFVGQFQRM